MLWQPPQKRILLPGDRGKCATCGNLLRPLDEKRDWGRPWEDRPGSASCCCQSCVCGLDPTATYHVTFGNSGKCPTLDGKTFALAPVGGGQCSWKASIACGSDTLTLNWIPILGATLCTQIRFGIGDTLSACLSGATNPTSCTCSPVNFVYSLSVGSGCLTAASCATANSFTIGATVTT